MLDVKRNRQKQITLGVPRNRSKHGVCVADNYLYMYGGKDGTLSYKDLTRYNLGKC